MHIGVWCIVLCFAAKVQPMVLKGPTYMRYSPCDLGILHFDKIAGETRWMGVFNLYLYPDMDELELKIQFKYLVTVSLVTMVQQNASIYIDGNNSTLVTLKPRGDLPKKYTFFVDPSDSDKDAVPYIAKLQLNDRILCDESIRLLQRKQFEERSDKGKVCGARAGDIPERIDTDAEQEFVVWPWHVALFVKEKDNKSIFQCGGSIISKTAVLTAGHCIEFNKRMVEADKLMVLAGTTNIRNHTSHGAQFLPAVEVIVHPSYSTVLATADLAIIKVSGFNYTYSIRPVCLWGPAYNKAELIGKYATIVGFGLTEDDTFHDILRTSNLLIQSDDTCKNQSSNVYTPLLNEFTFCAGYGDDGGSNTRNGDSGGGLVMGVVQPDNTISWYLTGVLSKCGLHTGDKYCDANFYTVYTNVAPHANWIQHHIQGVDSSMFDKIVESADRATIKKFKALTDIDLNIA